MRINANPATKKLCWRTLVTFFCHSKHHCYYKSCQECCLELQGHPLKSFFCGHHKLCQALTFLFERKLHPLINQKIASFPFFLRFGNVHFFFISTATLTFKRLPAKPFGFVVWFHNNTPRCFLCQDKTHI